MMYLGSFFLDELKKELATNDEFRKLWKQILGDPTSKPGYSVKEGLIVYQGRIGINPNSRLKTFMMKEFHETP